MTANQPQPIMSQPSARQNRQTQRWSIVGAVLLCTLISAILADSLLSVWQTEIGEPISRGWVWLLGGPAQTFGTQTAAFLLGIVLLGFAFGGVWFTVALGFRWLRSQLF